MPGQPSQQKKKRGLYSAIRLTLSILMLLSTAIVVCGLSGLFGGSSFIVTLLAGLLLAIFTAAHVYVASYIPTRRGLTRPDVGASVDVSTVRAESVEFSKQFNPEQIQQYVKAILQPGELRGRLIEEIQPLRRTLRQRVLINLEMPADHKGDLLFPVLTPVKGELQDDLTITVDGESVVTLTHRDCLLLTSIVLDALLVPAEGLTESEVDQLTKLADQALKIVLRRGRVRNATEEDVRRVNDCAEEILSLAPKGGDSLRLAASLVRKLADNYVIVVIVPSVDITDQQRKLVSYERFLIPNLRLATWRSPLRLVRDFLGTLMGARPVSLGLSVSNASTAQSYHLFVMGPEGMYVGWQDMPDTDGIFEVQSLDEQLTQPYGRFQRRRGQRYLHLYMRSIPERLANKLRLNVRFFEVPPGTMGAATLAASASFVLIYLAGLILPTASNFSTDFPAIVLAFPALAGALVGFESRTNSLLGGTVSSKSSAVLTIILSLGASGLFMAQRAEKLKAPSSLVLLAVRDRWWQVLVLVALLNALYAGYVWLTRTASFYWLAHRPDDPHTGPSEH
ncbi:hypothetical protein [Lentzea californiensis]|uniref:hypothetical protein n=1 Tax=Lentzea californiensis TaxID=438851 RepID=UPI0021644CA3|nr:hypothetical protein [Lentzea californiensis]MCR3748795.1 hypothetical protein [Lentzea californiensis]